MVAMKRLQRAVNHRDPNLSTYKQDFESSKKGLERLVKNTKAEYFSEE